MKFIRRNFAKALYDLIRGGFQLVHNRWLSVWLGTNPSRTRKREIRDEELWLRKRNRYICRCRAGGQKPGNGSGDLQPHDFALGEYLHGETFHHTGVAVV